MDNHVSWNTQPEHNNPTFVLLVGGISAFMAPIKEGLEASDILEGHWIVVGWWWCIRESPDHFQSDRKHKKQPEVHRSTLPKAKCPLLKVLMRSRSPKHPDLVGEITEKVFVRANLKSNHLVTKRCPLLPWISGVAAGVLVGPNLSCT